MLFPRNWRATFVGMVMLMVMMVGVSPAQAQGLSIPGLNDGGKGEEQVDRDPQALRDSLDRVIGTLENDAQRGELLSKLKELRQATQTVSPDKSEERSGLLGALADSFTAAGEQARAGEAPLDIWAQRSRRAGCA